MSIPLQPAPVSSAPLPSAQHAPLTLLIILLVTLVPPLLGSHFRESRHTMENVALVSSQETWLRWHEGTASPLITYNDDLPRYEKPPLLVWLNMLAWTGVDPLPPNPDVLVLRARFVTVGLGCLTVLSIYWLGCSIRSARLGVLAALIAGSMIFLQRQAQTASYDMHFTAWATLAVAAAFALVGRTVGASPAGLTPTLRAIRIGGSGGVLSALLAVSTFAAVMSKNPLAYVLILPPVIACVLAQPAARLRALGRVLLAVAIASVPVVAWYIYVRLTVADSAYHLQKEFKQLRSDPQPWYYYVGIFGLVAPWSIWLVGGLLHAVSRNAATSFHDRRALRAVFLWFAFILVFFSLWQAKQQRYILPIVPPAALLVAWLWLDHDRSSSDQPAHRCRSWVIHLHWFILLACSLFFAAFCMVQNDLPGLCARASDLLTHDNSKNFPLVSNLHDALTELQPVLLPLSPFPAVVLFAVLAAITFCGWRQHRTGRAFSACICTALWALVLTSVFWVLYGMGPDAVHPLRPAIAEFSAHVDSAPVRAFIHRDDEDGPESQTGKPVYRLNEEFRFYYGRLIHRIKAEDLARFARSLDTVFVLSKSKSSYEKPLRAAGFTFDRKVQTDSREFLDLWINRPVPVPPASVPSG